MINEASGNLLPLASLFIIHLSNKIFLCSYVYMSKICSFVRQMKQFAKSLVHFRIFVS